MQKIRQIQVPLQKYIALMELQERNEGLFYKLLIDNIGELLPVVYSPTVRVLGFCRGKILEVLNNWLERTIQVIVVTNGEQILGLGDLGCQVVMLSIIVFKF
ncbi:nadp-dependent malic enzyme [Quercus suber]|uniref:Nadp-dependent malic enzyme n=1 Tax=Quercus suber TaxID=58331 RepID=A0AAW0MCG0_QUESU